MSVLFDSTSPRTNGDGAAKLMEARVLNPPISADGWLRVEVDAQRGRTRECPWPPRADLEPAPGDAALCAESDNGMLWVVAWWSQSGAEPQLPGEGLVPWDIDPASANAVTRLRMNTLNFLANAGFEHWNAGADIAPDAWTLAGDATIARSDVYTMPSHSAEISFGAGNSGELYQAIEASDLVDYTYSCYVQRIAGAGAARLVAQNADPPYQEYESVGLGVGAGWQLAVLTVKPTVAGRLRFAIKSADGTPSTWLVDECMLQESKGIATTFQFKPVDDTTEQNIYGNKYFGYTSHYLADLVAAPSAPGHATRKDYVDGADAAHAALKTGIHGIPAMANGQGLLWTGAGWTATDLATQAELDAEAAARLAADNGLDARLDVLEGPRPGAGRVVGATQTDIPFTNADSPLLIYGGPGATNPMQLSVTPPYACWWPVFGEVLARTVDAAWHRFNVKLRLSVPDVFGQRSLADGIMHHSAASDWNHARPSGMFALAANTAYTVSMVFDGATGGNWRYYQGGGAPDVGHTYIFSPGVIRR